MGKKSSGRPVKKIDKTQFEALCKIQCTQEEICSVLGVTDKTLTKWCKKTYKKYFSEVFKEKRQLGYMSLRRNMWSMARDSVPMSIFLAKNYLGMSDKNEQAIVFKDIENDDALSQALDELESDEVE